MPPSSKNKDPFSDAEWLAWFDGSAKPNPGQCNLACILKGKNNALYRHTTSIGYGDSSDAEYQALLAALLLITDKVPDVDRTKVLLRGDSQVVINDVLGPDHKASARLTHYRLQARSLMAALPGLTLKWVPRHKNTEVDALMRSNVDIKLTDTAA